MVVATPILSRCPVRVLGGVLIIALAIGLYGPFFGNPRVFDDWTFFSGNNFFYYATHPFGLELRVPPLFSLAITEVLIGGTVAHRVVSLVFHVACALALYKLITELLPAALRSGDQAPIAGASASTLALNVEVPALVAAAVFAIHPVAVYGAAYLMQRTIVFATLFSLLSLFLFVRGAARGRHADALAAALMYSVAVLSKEHSVLLPAAAVLALPLIRAERRFALRYAVIYLVACAPAALYVIVLRKWLLGAAYEPFVTVLAGEIEGIFGQNIADHPWFLSVVTQAGLFFQYMKLWLWPDTAAMSIDLRVNFFDTWSPLWIALKLSAFLGAGVLGLVLLRRRGRVGLVGFGVLYFLIMFVVEMSTARFQEPFVLYRSYLWAPGLLIALGALLSAVPWRVALAAFALAAPVLLYQAHDRLETFSDLRRMWEDAVAKLPAKPIPYGSRTLYNLAREYAYANRMDEASAIANRCMTQYPNAFHCYTAVGMIHSLRNEYAQALPYIAHAAELNPKDGVARYRVALLLERLGRLGEAKAAYRLASELGFKGADIQLARMQSTSAPGP